MSSPNRSTSDIEDAFSSMNILNYTSVSSDYFPASAGSKLPISPPDPITSPAILTPSLVLPPSLLFDPRYFFIPEELLPPKKRIRSPSSSSTTLSNSSRNQTHNLVSPSSSVYTPTPPQIFEIGKCSIKMYLKHHEKQVEDILNYLDELSFHRIEKMEEGRINGNELKTELKRIRTQIIKHQKKRLGQKDKIAFAHYRISDLEQIIEKIQAQEAKIQLTTEQVDWRDDTNDEPEDQELEAHYLSMAQIQEVTPNAANNSGPIFDAELLQKMSTNGDQADHDDDDLARERNLLASLIEKLKCETDDNKNQSSNNHFKEANTELVKNNELMFKDLKKFQAEFDRYHDVNYASKVEIECAKAKGELVSHKMSSEKLFNEYTRKINDLNQTILEMKKELIAHQESISIMSQEKEAQKKFYKTHEDKDLEKVIALENKIKVLDDIVYKTGQSVQIMNMLNHNYKMSFVKLEFLKKAQRANPCLYDIG
ncbi:hypothetical protein Tco_0007263 [Tanacetum coccineum]